MTQHRHTIPKGANATASVTDPDLTLYAKTVQVQTESANRIAADTALGARVTKLEVSMANALLRIAAVEAHFTPTVTPPPTRPFAAPVTTGTYTVPGTITHDGSADAAAALATFITGVPNGSIVAFPAGGTYLLNSGLSISGRNNLVFQGNGSILHVNGSPSSMWNDAFVLYGPTTTDIAISGFTILGNNPGTGSDMYDSSNEGQPGIGVYGALRVEIIGNTFLHAWGDGVYVGDEPTGTGTWADYLWVHANTFDYIGRNAFTVNAAQNVWLQANSIDHVGGSVLDIEPDTDTQGVDALTMSENTVGAWGMSSSQYTMHFAACASQWEGPSSTVNGVTITGNTVSGGPPNTANNVNSGGLYTWIGKPARQTAIVFTGNSTTHSHGGSDSVMRFEHCDGLTIGSNTQPKTAGALYAVTDCTSVVGP